MRRSMQVREPRSPKQSHAQPTQPARQAMAGSYQAGSLQVRCHAISLSALCALTACGGSSESDFATAHGLRAQAYIYQNLMPSFADIGSIGCVPLYVVLSIRAESGAFPQGVRATTVSLTQEGRVVWQQPVDPSQSGLWNAWTTASDWISLFGSTDGKPPPGTMTEQVLRVVTHGCTTPSLRTSNLAQANVRLEAGGKASLVSVVVAIEAVH